MAELMAGEKVNTSKSNVLFSNSAQSTRGVLSFIRSFLAAASLPAITSSSPAGGSGGSAFATGVATIGYFAAKHPGRSAAPFETVSLKDFVRSALDVLRKGVSGKG